MPSISRRIPICNVMNQATELNVTLTVNGAQIVPTYTASNYTYGIVGETSNAVNFSANSDLQRDEPSHGIERDSHRERRPNRAYLYGQQLYLRHRGRNQ